MSTSKIAVKESIPRVARRCKYLYLAAHGTQNGIDLEGGVLTPAELKKCLLEKDCRLTGLYLSVCCFGTRKLVDYLFGAGVRLRWIAGYSESPHWIASLSLDLLFFDALLGEQAKGEARRQHLEATAERLRCRTKGLMKELGFGFYYRSPRTGVVVNLVGG